MFVLKERTKKTHDLNKQILDVLQLNYFLTSRYNPCIQDLQGV